MTYRVQANHADRWNARLGDDLPLTIGGTGVVINGSTVICDRVTIHRPVRIGRTDMRTTRGSRSATTRPSAPGATINHDDCRHGRRRASVGVGVGAGAVLRKSTGWELGAGNGARRRQPPALTTRNPARHMVGG
jgi:hypothetical protein